MNSSVKLMLIVREPVTRAISDYTQLRSHAATPSSSAQAQKSFEQLALRADGSVNEAYKPLAVSLYHTFTHRWLEVLFQVFCITVLYKEPYMIYFARCYISIRNVLAQIKIFQYRKYKNCYLFSATIAAGLFLICS